MQVAKQQFLSLIRKKIKKRFEIESLDEPITISEKDVYDIFMESLMEEIIQGNDMMLRSFGAFRLKPHKGHKAFFSEKPGTLHDYLTLRFYPSNAFIRRIRNSDLKVSDFEDKEPTSENDI